MFYLCSHTESRRQEMPAALVAGPSSGPSADLLRGRREPPADPAGTVAAVLDRTEAELDYLDAKLAFDAVVDPSADKDAARAEVERLAGEALGLCGAGAASARRLAALRTVIYESGPWNGHRPFRYDHNGFKAIRPKLLASYLSTRLGNCVSMPVLFLILAERLGLDVAFASAPCHLYVRHRDELGRVINLEPTSGAEPARDVWIRQNFRISDRAVESGLYMRSLPRREGIAAMAETVVHHLKEKRRWEEVVAVCEVVLRHSPRDIIALTNLGTACANILRAEFLDKYRSVFLIPVPLRARYSLLLHKNHEAFAKAEALGWEPIQELPPGPEGVREMERMKRC